MTVGEIKHAVRTRDGFKCVDCSMTDEEHRQKYRKGLHVHRLKPGSSYAVDGCVTVCRKCHYVRHRHVSGPSGKLRAMCFILPPPLAARLKAFQASFEFPPTTSRIMRQAVQEFLAKQVA